MSEPTTAAGRSLLDDWGPKDDPEYPQVGTYVDYRAEFIDGILGIEAEARRAALDEAIATVERERTVACSRGFTVALHVRKAAVIDALTRLRDGA